MCRYALRDDQWRRIKHLLPGKAGDVGVTAKDNRLFVDAVLYRYRAGIPWRDLPERFGDFRNIHTRPMRPRRKNVWKRVFKALAEAADNEYVMIDSTIVRAHQHSAGAKGSSKKGRPRALAGRFKHQDPCDLRRPGQSSGRSPDAGTGERSGRRRCSDR